MAEELKPCPFCGGEARRFDFDYDTDDPNFGGSMIECSHCEACTAVEFDRKETLYDRWNNRPEFRAGMEKAAEIAEEHGLIVSSDIVGKACSRNIAAAIRQAAEEA